MTYPTRAAAAAFAGIAIATYAAARPLASDAQLPRTATDTVLINRQIAVMGAILNAQFAFAKGVDTTLTCKSLTTTAAALQTEVVSGLANGQLTKPRASLETSSSLLAKALSEPACQAR